MKIKRWLGLLIVFIIGILQSTALDYVSLLGVKPDLLLISVIFVALYFGRNEGLKTAVLAGLLKDAASAVIFGSNAFSFCLCVLFLARYGKHFYKQRITTQVLLCGFIYYAAAFVVIIINQYILSGTHTQLSAFGWMGLRAAIYTGLVAPILFYILNKVYKRFYV